MGIATTNIDECEMVVEIEEMFTISRSDFEEFKEKLEILIDEYRI